MTLKCVLLKRSLWLEISLFFKSIFFIYFFSKSIFLCLAKFLFIFLEIEIIICLYAFEYTCEKGHIKEFTVPLKLADQMVQWLEKPAAVPEVPGSNPG